jgi:hypothetical protein
LVLVDVLDQSVPHDVGHRLAPLGRDALRRIPQLVVDLDAESVFEKGRRACVTSSTM